MSGLMTKIVVALMLGTVAVTASGCYEYNGYLPGMFI